jgi:hypothetical protein
MEHRPITSHELDEVIEHWISGANVDQSALDKEAEAIVDAIKGSPKAREALMGSVVHIATQGEKHIPCGLMQSVAAFFVVAMRVAEQRQKAAGDIAELDRMMGLEEGR